MVEENLDQKRWNDTYLFYARIWIDSRSIDISTKVAVLEKHWCNKANRARTRTKNSKNINDILDGISSNIKSAYKQPKDEGRPITAPAIKSRYFGKDKAVLTCRDLMDYHRVNELEKLAPGTAKNYGATENTFAVLLKRNTGPMIFTWQIWTIRSK